MQVEVHRKQWPVGHGGFATGSLMTNGESFHYIYDCGAMKSDVIKKRIQKWCKENGEIVDALFVSHFDRDHINGLDYLLSKVKVRRIFLPYLTDLDTFMLGAKLLMDDDITKNSADILADPVRWFKERGATEVIGVKRKSWPSNDVIYAEDIDENMPVADRLNMGRNPSHDQNIKTGSRKAPYLYDRILPTESYQALLSGNLQIIWILAPFVPPFGEEYEIAKMVSDLKTTFNIQIGEGSLNSGVIAKILLKKENHPKIKKIYLDYAKNINSLSMCLYSGPRGVCKSSSDWSAAFVRDEPILLTQGTKCGWIGTGDYNLKSEKSLDTFSNHFSPFKDDVASFMVPHHGSGNNFSQKAADDFAPELFFVNCPTGSSNHPHQDTLDIIKDTGRPLARVKETDKSSLTEVIKITIPHSHGAILELVPMPPVMKKKQV